MKKYLMLFLVVLLASSAAHAQTNGYLGLFTDETRTSWCFSPPSVPTGTNMYVMALPNTDGLKCVEFAVDYSPASPDLLPSMVTLNPTATVSLGDIATGISICFQDCHTDWLFVCSQLLVVYEATPMFTMSIQPHSGSGHVYFASCIEPDRPKYDAIPFTNFYLNAEDGVDPECGQTATPPASWGAVKSLYN